MTFTPSPARTIPYVGWANIGSLSPAPLPMVWPVKEPADVLDYSVNVTAWLNDGGEDTLASVTVTPLSTVPGDVAIATPLIVTQPGLITAWLSYGQAGANYSLEYSIVTAAARTATFPVHIAVPSDLPNPTPPVDPPVPVTWTAS